MLVVLEGLDGAGKSTQVKRLRSYLEEIGPSLEYIHFPRYDAPVWGGLISRFLKGGFGPLETVHPQLVALLFAGDRKDAGDIIRRSLDEGKTVLLDRYVYSNIAYQCAKLPPGDSAAVEELRGWIFRTEYEDFRIPRPDLNIFLDVPIGFVESNLQSQRTGSDRDYLDGASDIHEADLGFQKRVRSMYLAQAASDPSFIVVDCSDADGRILPADEISARVRKVVDEHMASNA